MEQNAEIVPVYEPPMLVPVGEFSEDTLGGNSVNFPDGVNYSYF